MIYKHRVQNRKHQFFLAQNRQDPITGDTIKENDIVVICAVCKSAFLEDSWNYMNGQHCNQSLTLKKIPKEKYLTLKQKKITLEEVKVRNQNYRGIFSLAAMILPITIFAILMANYIKPTNTGLLMILGSLTVGITVVLIMFVDDIFRDKPSS